MDEKYGLANIIIILRLFEWNFPPMKKLIMDFNKPSTILLVILLSSLFWIFTFWGSNLKQGLHFRITPANTTAAPPGPGKLLVLEDKRQPKLSEFLKEAVEAMRNLPRPPFISVDRSRATTVNSSCAVPPSVLDVQFVNTYWQLVKTFSGSLYLYGAYYDDRSLTKKALNSSVVRILGIMDRYLDSKEADTFYCQLRFENESVPVISKVTDRQDIWIWGKQKNQPYLFACPIPSTHQGKVPKSVSVATTPCESTLNILGVQHDIPLKGKGSFAVCGRAYHFREDMSILLIEWIELNRILGAEKITLYDYGVHPNMSKVMNYYKSTGFMDVIPTTHPGYLPNEPRLIHLYHKNENKSPDNWIQELSQINDCLYKNLHSYEYIAVIDPDEVIMPLGKTRSWTELMKDVKKSQSKKFNESACIAFRNVYFFDHFMNNRSWFQDIPWYNYHLQHVYRANNYSEVGYHTKCFHRVERVITLHNHVPINCFGGCRCVDVDNTKAHLQHYKRGCNKDYPETNCTETFGKNPVRDTSIWKYKDELIDRTEKVLKTLGFLVWKTDS